MKHLQRLLREPLLHFFAIGGLIFLLFAAVNDTREVPTDVIVITPERIDQLAAGFNSVWRRMPTDDELDALIDEDVREEVYYREALALGERTSTSQTLGFVSSAHAKIGRPLTPVSVAGVGRSTAQCCANGT
jgi:hypothetical protein